MHKILQVLGNCIPEQQQQKRKKMKTKQQQQQIKTEGKERRAKWTNEHLHKLAQHVYHNDSKCKISGILS